MRLIINKNGMAIGSIGILALLAVSLHVNGQPIVQSLKSFGVSGANNPSSLVQGRDGALYGTSDGTGTNIGGTVFKLNTNGSGYTMLHSFSGPGDGSYPNELMQGTNGVLYGTTHNGGISNSCGTVFKLNTDGTGYAVLYSFCADGEDGGGALPGGPLLQAVDGALYGTTYFGGTNRNGTVFKVNTDGTGYAVLHRFTGSNGDGYDPNGGLVQGTNGALYGTTWSGGSYESGGTVGGTVFKLNTDGSGYSVLHSFAGFYNGDGTRPSGSLVLGPDGALYGTTGGGGSFNYGTVFKLNTDGSGYTILYDFMGNNVDGIYPIGVVLGGDGALYGMTHNGTVFKLNTDGSGYNILYTLTDTAPWYSVLAGADGALYGTTFYDSAPSALGTVFRLSTDGTGYAQLYSFTSSSGDGAYPAGSLIQGRDGDLYGTTTAGGLIINGIFYNNGTVFKLKPDGTGYTLLYNFTGTLGDGAYPAGSLIQGSDGALYGTTAGGGTFKLNTDGTGYTLLHVFSAAQLLQGDDGALYGTTADVGNGAVFKLNTDGTGYTILHGFSGGSADGVDPTALLQGSDGALYGTTESGGTNYAGTIFRLNTDGSGYTILYSFPWEMGSPVALVQGSDGTLYGMAVYLDLYGGVFKLNTDGSHFVTIHDFTGSLDGGLNNTTGGLVQGSDGLLYGTTPIGGTNDSGTIFKLSTDGTSYTVLYSFTGIGGDGLYPGGGLVQGKDGAFFGTTRDGGNNGEGLLFRLGAVPPAQLTQLVPSPGGAFQLTLAGVPYVVWRIQAATNLSPPVTWLTLTNLTTTNGTAQFNDSGAPNFPGRYYRAVWP